MKKKQDSVPVNVLIRNSKKTAKERLREFFELFGKEDEVLVIINADPDAVASAMAVKRLLRYRVKSVVIGYPNEIRRLSNLAMLDLLKIQLEKLQGLKLKNFTKKIILDSQPTHLPCFEKIKFDAVIDHHPPTNGWTSPFVDVRKDYGATASMFVEYLRAADIKPSVSLATALFYAIKVDTQNFEKKANLADAISFRYLFNIANQNLVRKIELSELRLSELNYFKTALAAMKVSKKRLYAHVGRVRNPDILVIIADFFNHVHQVSWSVVSGIHGERLVVIFRCDGYKTNAGKLAEKTFAKYGSAGGHREAARAEVPLKNLLAADEDFTTDTLKRLTTKHM
ncbi:MAG: DHH family phosphoesterase [Proteobacteria bacterium]|nr:DHH family phosphoesterase [Pseudomonadota bacterium]MBU1715445.1 DHH family phosphoesterase [Pseudomonadota bacterium]